MCESIVVFVYPFLGSFKAMGMYCSGLGWFVEKRGGVVVTAIGHMYMV